MKVKKSILGKIRRDIKKEKKDLDIIENDVKHLTERLIERRPDHFSKRDVINAFFGALFLGLTFMFKGLLVEYF